jgi:hypothetical protein
LHGHESVKVQFKRDERYLTVRFDGQPDASTTIYSDEGLLATANGNAQIDTSIKKYGTGSLLLDGTGDYIDFKNVMNWNIWHSDCTVEFWTRITAFNGVLTPFIEGYMSSLGFWSIYLNESTSKLYLYEWSYGNTRINFSVDWSPSIDTWYHIAVQRRGHSIQVYINGVKVADQIVSFLDPRALRLSLRIGTRTDTTRFLNGYMDNIIIRRFAAYDGDFTPADIKGVWSSPQSLIPTDENQSIFAPDGGRYMTKDMALLTDQKVTGIKTKLNISGAQTLAVKGISTHYK